MDTITPNQSPNRPSDRKVIAMIHTSSTMEPVFERLRREKHLDVEILHITDDTVISEVIAEGCMSGAVSDRVRKHIAAAEAAEADYILVTCSSIGGAVDEAQQQKVMRVPLMRVDQPMADRAISMGRRIGVLATLQTTMDPTCKLLRDRAAAAGKDIELIARVCTGAFDAFLTGKLEEHDAQVTQALRELAAEVDVVVLAQASMARVAEALPPEALKTPVLSSPGLAMEHLASVL